MKNVLSCKMKILFRAILLLNDSVYVFFAAKSSEATINTVIKFPWKTWRVLIPVLLVLSGLWFQGCTSVETKTKILVKKNKHSESGRIALPIEKAPKDLSAIPDGEYCKLHPLDPSCPINSAPFAGCPAQQFLDSIPPIAQDADVWCWAASAESIMKTYGTNKKQCQILNEVEGLTIDCCSPENEFNPICLENGWPHEAFNNPRTSTKFDFEYIYGPLPMSKLFHVLCQYGPISFVIRMHGGGGHSFVVKDIEIEDGELFLLVHDHSWVVDDQGRRAAEFKKWSYEAFAEGVWLGLDSTNSDHFVDYFEVKRLP